MNDQLSSLYVHGVIFDRLGWVCSICGGWNTAKYAVCIHPHSDADMPQGRLKSNSPDRPTCAYAGPCDYKETQCTCGESYAKHGDDLCRCRTRPVSAQLRQIAGDLADIAANPPTEIDSAMLTKMASQLLALAGHVYLGESK